MRTRWGSALGSIVLLTLAAVGCSSSSSSKGVVSTTIAAETTVAPAAGGSDTTVAATTGDTTVTTTAAAPAAKQGGTMTVGLDSEPPSLDPAGNSSSLANGSVYDALYDSLMRFLPDGTVTPMLADSLTESADRLSWTLTLKTGIKFHDGTPFDATAVKFNLDRQKTSPYNSPSILPLQSVEIVDDHTLTLKLDQPWTALPNSLAGIVGVMASPTPTVSNPDALLRNPVGTGPYTFKEWAPGDRIVVDRNPEYWGDKQGALDEIVFKLLPVEAARVAAYEAGELDAMVTINDETANTEKDAGKQVVSPPSTGFGLTLLNNTKPPFDDIRVRQALAIGYDRDAVTSAYQGQGYADYAWSPFVKGSTWWTAPKEPLKYDKTKAAALLADYGKPVEFTLLVLAGNQMVEDSTRATVEYWTELGMKVNVEIVPDLSTYVTRTIAGDFQAVGWIYGSFGDPDGVVYNSLHSGGSSNYGKYSNPQVDTLVEQGRTEEDDTKRHAIYDQVQELFRNDVPYLQASHGSIFVIANDNVTGLGDSIFFPSRNVAFTAG